MLAIFCRDDLNFILNHIE